MTNDIFSLDTIEQFLETHGYEVVARDDDAVITRVGNFPTVITITDVDGDGDPDIRITTQLTTLGQIPEARVPAFLTAALDVNTRILPFAVATLTAEDGEGSDPSEFPVVLIDSIPVGDISEDEFQSALDSLLIAILGTRQLLEIGFGSLDIPQEQVQLRRSQLSRTQLGRLTTSLRGRTIDSDFGIEDLIEIMILADLLIDDGFFFGEEPIAEDPLAEDETVVVDETVEEELPRSEIEPEPAPVVEEETRRFDPPAFDDEPTRSFGGDSGGSSFDSGGSDFGGSDD